MSAWDELQVSLRTTRAVLSERGYSRLFLALLILLALAYTVLANVWSPYLRQVNDLVNPFSALLVYAIAAMTALVLTLVIYRYRAQSGLAGSAGTGFAGVALSLFATACPICPPFWVAVLGLTGSLFFLADVSTWVELASLAMLTVSWHFTAKGISTSGVCPVPTKR